MKTGCVVILKLNINTDGIETWEIVGGLAQ